MPLDSWGREWNHPTPHIVADAADAAAPAVAQWLLEHQRLLDALPAEDVLTLTVAAAVAYLTGQGMMRIGATPALEQPHPPRLDSEHAQMMREFLDEIVAQHANRFPRTGR